MAVYLTDPDDDDYGPTKMEVIVVLGVITIVAYWLLGAGV